MFKKDKLDRLIEKQDVKHKANYDVLDCVKGKIQTEEFDGNGVVSINRKKTIIIVCCIAMLIVLITGLLFWLLGICLQKRLKLRFLLYITAIRKPIVMFTNLCQNIVRIKI